MALDNAQFISELSITDPPGTDPLSEGDDQIRTSKRTQQQSFPLIDAAVNKTSAQLNDVAQQSEDNTFSALNTFQLLTSFNLARGNDGSVSGPTWSFTSEINTGMFLDQPGVLALGITGTQVFRAALSNVRALVPWQATDGTEAAPSYSFTTSPSTGFYKPSSGVLAWGVGGSELFRASTSAMTFVGAPQIRHVDGSAALPAYSFSNNTNLGIYRSAANEISFATAGVRRFLVGSTGSTTFGQAQIDALTDTVADLRYLRAGVNRWQIRMANESGFTVNNLQFRRFDTSGVFQDVPLELDLERGQIIMAELPTNASGLFAGMLWRNGNIVNIV